MIRGLDSQRKELGSEEAEFDSPSNSSVETSGYYGGPRGTAGSNTASVRTRTCSLLALRPAARQVKVSITEAQLYAMILAPANEDSLLQSFFGTVILFNSMLVVLKTDLSWFGRSFFEQAWLSSLYLPS